MILLINNCFVIPSEKSSENNKGKGKQKKEQELCHFNITNYIKGNIESKLKYPHCFIELTKNDFKLYQQNSMIISGIEKITMKQRLHL